ncbi:MAG TPA: HEAT repeat domain-containing protein [Opitutaceae bacterium]|nr:HEAT repeat domain-containing protein [Opitutaceae bacterium]
MSAPSPLLAQGRKIGAINFYGYTGLDLNRLRAALPFHEGDPFPSREQLAAARAPFAAAIGRNRVKFSPNCCLPDGSALLFVGIEEPNAPPLVFNPKPTGEVRLPADFVQLHVDHMRAIASGVEQGKGGGDESQGYRLMEYPPARALELKIRDYAQAHPAELITVLNESSDATHRTAAAVALGYAPESSEQIAALVRASFDPDGNVRDEAVRALSSRVEHNPKLLKQVPLKGYLAMLHSTEWLDRNKAAALIDSFSKARDPDVLNQLRENAVVPLREIVQWKDFSHAMSAFEILGRIAGWDEQRILELCIKADVEPILNAAR